MAVNKLKKIDIMKRIVTVVLIIVIISTFAFFANLYSQEKREIELTAQGILARVDKILEYPMGLIKGRIKHIKSDGKDYTVELTGRISKEDYLFIFKNNKRGEQLKVLYNLSGEDIWVYNIHSIKLFHKIGIDKYDPIFSSNFYFIDLSNADFQSNYTAAIEGGATIEGRDVYRLKLMPIFRGGQYGKIIMYVTKDKLIPVRIDYHDRDNAIFKFMEIAKVMEKGDKIIPIRYEMMNIKNGTITIMSFFSFEDNVKFNKEIFRSEKLGE